jgi:hypothetical protein
VRGNSIWKINLIILKIPFGIPTYEKNQSCYNLLDEACANIESIPISIFKYLIEIKGASRECHFKSNPSSGNLEKESMPPNQVEIVDYLTQMGCTFEEYKPKIV